MRRLAFALMICLLAIGASAQTALQPKGPPFSSQPQGNGSGEQSGQEPQSTATPTIVVNMYPSPKTEAEASKEEAERKEKAGLDRRMVELTADLAAYTKWLAFATIVLTIATAGLFAFAALQARDVKEAGRAARESAEAAKRSAETAVSAERARLVISKVSLDGQGDRPHRDRLRRCAVNAHAINYGRSPAFVRRTCIDVFCGDRLPVPRRYRNGTPPIDAVVEARDEHHLETGRLVDGPLSDEDVEGILEGSRTLWAFGYVWYGDVFGETQTARFCGRIVVSEATRELTWVSGGPTAYTKST